MSEIFVTERLPNHYLCKRRTSFPNEYLEQLIQQADQIRRHPFKQSRGRGLLRYRDAEGCEQVVFGKRYEARTADSPSTPKPLRLLRLLFHRYAWREGHSAERFEQLGLKTPKVLAYGEQWQWGVRGKGVVFFEFTDAQPVQFALQAQWQQDLLEQTAIALAKIHTSGYVHGDPVLHNFLIGEQGLEVIDVEYMCPYSQRKAVRELQCYLQAVARENPDPQVLERALAAYCSVTGVLPAHRDAFFPKDEQDASEQVA